MFRVITLGLFVLETVLAVACSTAGAESVSTGGDNGPVALPSGESNQPGYGVRVQFIARACEWLGPVTPPATCAGERPAGYEVELRYREADRWLIYDPMTNNVAYVDEADLDLPPELVRTPSPPRTTVIYIDRSASYRNTLSALSAVADLIERTARPGYVYYLRWLEDNSYRPEAEIVQPIRMPGISTPAPTPSAPQATSTPCTNIYDRPCRDRRQQESEEQQRKLTAPTATAEAAQALGAAYLKERVRELRAVRPAQASKADIDGAFRKAAELLRPVRGEKYLLLAAALTQPSNEIADLRLDRVKVRFAYVQCDYPVQCASAKEDWARVIARMGAADTALFLDPGQDLMAVMN